MLGDGEEVDLRDVEVDVEVVGADVVWNPLVELKTLVDVVAALVGLEDVDWIVSVVVVAAADVFCALAAAEGVADDEVTEVTSEKRGVVSVAFG